jgi:hypothetical protein
VTSIRASVWVSALALAAAVASPTFSAAGAGTRAGGTPDPCRLLSAAEIEAAVDAWVADGQAGESKVPIPGLRLCVYATASRWGGVVVSTQRPGPKAFRTSRVKAEGISSTTRPGYRRHLGLGDDAFSVGGSVSVLQGNCRLSVFAQFPGTDFTPVALRLARDAVRALRPLPECIVRD